MIARSTLRRRVLLLGGAGALVTLGLCAVFHRPIISHVVTVLAFRDAEKLAVDLYQASEEAWDDGAMGDVDDSIASKYASFFTRGFFDRWEVASRFPPSGLTREAVPAMVVITAFYKSNLERYRTSGRDDFEILAAEFAEWLDPVASIPGPKELLVNLLVTDATFDPDSEAESGGLPKLWIFMSLFCEGKNEILDCMSREEVAPIKTRLLGLVTPEHWASVIRHAEHPREKVRAGSLLLLNRHPSEDVIVERARRALDDPSEWVRLAGAGLLAIRRIDLGEDVLTQGLVHERWEVRFWCIFGLFQLAKPGLAEGLEALLLVETDEWLKGEIQNAIKGLRPGTEPR